MKKLVSKLKLDNSITWLHNINDTNDLKILYQNALLTVYPSHYEGFGIPIIESLLCKTPVITSKISALPEAAGPDQVFISPDDNEDLSHQIQTLCNDPTRREIQAAKGYQHVINNFLAEKTANDLAAIYRSIK